MWDTYKEMGIQEPKECAGGDKEGICWVPTSQHPVTARRSHSGLGHYAAVIDTRPNYDLLVKHQGVRVAYPNKGAKTPLVEVRSLEDNRLFNVTAKAEVIISAGALHTPTVLMRSGIAGASVLKAAGIPVVLDLPGVGSNLQDHSGPPVSWNCMFSLPHTITSRHCLLTPKTPVTNPPDFQPTPADMSNPDFLADATAAFNETPATGPYTLALGNTAIYVSLPHMSPTATDTILSKLNTMLREGTIASYLPADYRDLHPMVLGYEHQLYALHSLLGNPQSPSLESPWQSGASAAAFLLHPLSRGTVRLNATDPLAQPILDYRAGSNPLDFDMHLAHVRYLRRAVDTPTMRKYGAVEVMPGAGVDSEDEEALRAYVRERITLSFMHPCCTAAMLPERMGGVVGTDLKVHGARGLRVVDMSVMPMVPGSHTSATAYAVGEKVSFASSSFLCFWLVFVKVLTDVDRLRILLFRSGGRGGIRRCGFPRQRCGRNEVSVGFSGLGTKIGLSAQSVKQGSRPFLASLGHYRGLEVQVLPIACHTDIYLAS
jgi:choline dehydrogenase-like flavoprotein